MKLRTKIVLIFLLFSAFTAVVMVSLYTQSSTQPQQTPPLPTPTPEFTIPERSISTWTPWWDENNTENALRQRIGSLDRVVPVLYKIAPDGTLGRQNVTNRQAIISIAKDNNITLTPNIGDDFDYTRVSTLLYDKDIQEQFQQQLVDEAISEGFDGWDINVETLKPKDQQTYTDFITSTARHLHDNNLMFTVTLYAKIENETFEASLAQDYLSIGQAVDAVEVMTYNFSNASTSPGGEAPLSWYRQVLTHATNTIPREKIIIGLSTHGRTWSEGEYMDYTHPQIQNTLSAKDAEVTYNNEHSSAVATFEENGDEHVYWYETADSITEKMDIAAQEFGLNKFILWRVGAEDPLLWEKIDESN